MKHYRLRHCHLLSLDAARVCFAAHHFLFSLLTAYIIMPCVRTFSWATPLCSKRRATKGESSHLPLSELPKIKQTHIKRLTTMRGQLQACYRYAIQVYDGGPTVWLADLPGSFLSVCAKTPLCTPVFSIYCLQLTEDRKQHMRSDMDAKAGNEDRCGGLGLIEAKQTEGNPILCRPFPPRRLNS